MKRLAAIDLRSFGLLSLSLVICLTVSEAIFRWKSFGADAWSYEKMKSFRHVGKSGVLQASAFQDILWELRPNLNTLYKLFPFQTNAEGLRDQEYPLVKPPGTYRIAVLGDSYTMAEGVAIEDAYHSVLERRFNALGDGRKYEFINFGVAGYSLVQYVSTLSRRVRSYKPDLILIGFCAANDSKLPNLEAFKKPYTVKSEKNGYIHFFFLEYLGNIYKDIYLKIRGREPGSNADPDYVKTQFHELKKISEADGVPIVMAYIDNKAASLDFELVKEAARAEGFEFIDGTTNFPPRAMPEYAISLTDGHPNGKANQIFADNIFPRLREITAAKR